MKELAFVMVLVMAGMLLMFLTLLQAASQSLKAALILSVLMGLVCSFIVAMIAFEFDETLHADALYKILFISQLASGMVSVVMTMQPCMNPRNWQRSMAEALQSFLDNVSSE